MLGVGCHVQVRAILFKFRSDLNNLEALNKIVKEEFLEILITKKQIIANKNSVENSHSINVEILIDINLYIIQTNLLIMNCQ